MNIHEKIAFIQQQIKAAQANHMKVTAVRLSPKDKYKLNWTSFQPIMLKFDHEVPEGQFVLETDAMQDTRTHARPA